MESPIFQKSTLNRSLVLAGGGVRLAYHAGVIKALEETDLKFNHVDGTSGGIFNTAMLAAGQNANEIILRWKNLKVFDFMSATPLHNYLKLRRVNAIGDADGIRQKVFLTLGISLEKINKNEAFQATFNVCNFSTKEIEAIPAERVSEDHLIAGMSLPIFMPAIKIGTDWYTDAVWVKDANLMEAVKRGADELYLVYCIGNSREYLEGSFLQYVHMIEMSAAGGLLAEFDWLVEINKQILLGKSPYGQQKPIKIHVIKPKYPLPLDPDLFMGHINIEALINMGYADAKNYLQSIENKGVNLDYKAAQMCEPGLSFQFLTKFNNSKNITLTNEILSFSFLFDFRISPGGLAEINYSGSIDFHENDNSICLYNNQANLIFINSKKYLSLESEFVIGGKIENFNAIIPLNNKADFWLGLEFKTMELQINSGKKQYFHQNIGTRIKSVFKSKIYQNASFLSKIKSKVRILNWIYSN